MGSMADHAHERAPRWRRTAAGLVDAAIFAGVSLRARKAGVVREADRCSRGCSRRPCRSCCASSCGRPVSCCSGSARWTGGPADARGAVADARARGAHGRRAGSSSAGWHRPRVPSDVGRSEALASESHAIFRRHPQASPERGRRPARAVRALPQQRRVSLDRGPHRPAAR